MHNRVDGLEVLLIENKSEILFDDITNQSVALLADTLLLFDHFSQ